MAYRRDSDWSLNKNTPDLVYRFLDGTTKRYRKSNGQIYEVVLRGKQCIAVILVPEDEMSVAQFDELKHWSDDDYQRDDNSEVHNSRGQVNLEAVANTLAASVPFEKEEEPEEFRTLENALRIVAALKLTETQRRRFLMHVRGLTTREIAAIENVEQPAIVQSLTAVKKKKEKYFSKLAAKHLIKTRKK